MRARAVDERDLPFQTRCFLTVCWLRLARMQSLGRIRAGIRNSLYPWLGAWCASLATGVEGEANGGGIRADRALSCADRRHRHGLIWVRGRGIAFLLFPAGRRVASSDLSLAIYTLCRLRCAPAAFTLFSSRNSLGVEGRQFFRGSTKPVDAVLEGASRIYFTASQVFQPSRAA